MCVLSQLRANGGLTLTLSQMATQAGKTLADGAHTIGLSAADKFHNVAPNLTVNFNIKTAAPVAPAQPVVVLASGSTQSGGLVNTSNVTVRTVGLANTIVRLYRDGVP